ncbi:MAG: Uma2 family endonuclease [Methylococcales bacterium]|nr:Uma2 family endonuclease [Methylococcales bacterium]
MTPITHLSQLDLTKSYSYADYLTGQLDDAVELIKSKIMLMLPAPDWIIEILSKGNSKKEMQLKYDLYEESGVLEYWLVYPYEKALHQFILNTKSKKYEWLAMFSENDNVTPHTFPNLKIDLNDVFNT